MEVQLPDKQYFKIGEVSDLLGVKPYVLRYWEKEFRLVRPQKTRTNQRIYARKDVELIARIKHLLYDEKYTIAGAKLQLREQMGHGRAAEADEPAPAAVAPKRSFIEEREKLLAERDDLAREVEMLREKLEEAMDEAEQLRQLVLRELRTMLAELGRDDARDPRRGAP
jgi:DNA-binding transcriptional MerR regulator